KSAGATGVMMNVADDKQALFYLRLCLTDHQKTYQEDRKKLESKESSESVIPKNFKSYDTPFDVESDTDLDWKLETLNEWIGTRVGMVSLQNVYDPRKLSAFA
ncbi:hypothetical protein PMAYCL1PPCAC_05735, partial [Pristionchus mayeri]